MSNKIRNRNSNKKRQDGGRHYLHPSSPLPLSPVPPSSMIPHIATSALTGRLSPLEASIVSGNLPTGPGLASPGIVGSMMSPGIVGSMMSPGLASPGFAGPMMSQDVVRYPRNPHQSPVLLTHGFGSVGGVEEPEFTGDHTAYTRTTTDAIKQDGVSVVLIENSYPYGNGEDKGPTALLFEKNNKYDGLSTTGNSWVDAKKAVKEQSHGLINIDDLNENKAYKATITNTGAGFTHLVYFIGVKPNNIALYYFLMNKRLAQLEGTSGSGASQMKRFFLTAIVSKVGEISVDGVPVKDTKGTERTISQIIITAFDTGFIGWNAGNPFGTEQVKKSFDEPADASMSTENVMKAPGTTSAMAPYGAPTFMDPISIMGASPLFPILPPLMSAVPMYLGQRYIVKLK